MEKGKEEKTREIANIKNSPLRVRVVVVARGTRTLKAIWISLAERKNSPCILPEENPPLEEVGRRKKAERAKWCPVNRR